MYCTTLGDRSTPLDVDIDKLSNGITETLNHLIATMFTDIRTESVTKNDNNVDVNMSHNYASN